MPSTSSVPSPACSSAGPTTSAISSIVSRAADFPNFECAQPTICGSAIVKLLMLTGRQRPEDLSHPRRHHARLLIEQPRQLPLALRLHPAVNRRDRKRAGDAAVLKPD